MDEPAATYRDAGVDIDRANEAVARIGEHARTTFNSNVLSDIGLFGGLYRLDLAGLEEPVLVASTDGVGTKVKVASAAKRHDTIGEDLVNHCVNDILVQGARPLFFLDYVASSRLDPDVIADVVGGIARGCRDNGAALLGGETAEMPGVYRKDELDVVGTVIGIVDRRRIIDGQAIAAGDVLLGLPAEGLHTNGYSLARRVLLELAGYPLHDVIPELGVSLADALLATHRSYLRDLEPALTAGTVKGLAHITGGGITENVPRILPPGLSARVRLGDWRVPPLFELIAARGKVEEAEMYRTFNMGVGMVVVAAAADAEALLAELPSAFAVGEIVPGDKNVEYA